MKTFIKTIIASAFVLTLLFAGSFVVNAAVSGSGQFDSDPAGNGTGFLSIHPNPSVNQGDCTNCANQNNSISVNAPNPGNTDTFSVYLDFRNEGTADITSARAKLNVSSSGNITGILTGTGASNSGISDGVNLNNLPSSFDINFISAYTENTHGAPNCTGYSYYNPGFTSSQIYGSGASIGTLDTVQNGWCDQGYLVVTLEVENTGNTSPNVEVTTLNPTGVTTSAATLNGRLDSGENVNVSFHWSTSSSVNCSNGNVANGPNSLDAVANFSKNISGLSANTTYYYVACGSTSNDSDQGDRKQFTTPNNTPNVSVQTLAEGTVTPNSAVLNGRLTQGTNATVWFAINTSTNVQCGLGSQTVPVSGTYSTGQFFNVTKTGLSPNTTYWYRACASQGGVPASGGLESFTTPNNNTYYWDIGDWGSCINGQQTRTVVCRDSNNNQVADSFCLNSIPGPKPPTQQACQVNGLSIISQNETDLSLDGLTASATANGQVVTGSTNYAYFVFAPSNINVSCFDNANQQVAENHTLTRTAGDEFEWNFSGLSLDTEYHYRACAVESPSGPSNQTAQGQIITFTTPDGNGGSNDRPDANTDSPRDVDEDSARLRGDIDMNDFNNGIVFFVYGQDEDEIRDTEDDHDSYDEAHDDEENDEFEVVRVDTDLDGSDDYEERVTNLDTDERYYYQICVEYYDNGSRLECGGVEDFETDRDGNNNDDVEIQTDAPRNVTQTTAEMCGTLVDDGGSSVQTWIEFRSEFQQFYTNTPTYQRNETSFCERVSGLSSNTTYLYRACTPEGCDTTRTFRTSGINIPQGQAPIITTDNPTNIRSNSANLNGTYVTNAPSGTCWFDYGRTSSLGRSTRTYNVNGYGACVHNFTGLASNTQYCVQAVIETIYGTDRGSVRCFNTPPGTGGPTPPPVVVVVDPTPIDLTSLGLGISLVRLDIDDNQEVVTQGENIQYVVEWQNVSELDLFDLELKVVMPPEIQVTDVSRGRFDQDENTLYFTISSLDGADVENNIPGERGELTVSGLVGRGTIGNLVTAEAQISYDNPINEAKETANDWDVDGYGILVAGVTASVFGLGNITFLGWLVILLGLFIIFLVARWLYLEREEMRAQAYAGYMPYAPAPQYGGGYAQPQMPAYSEPEPQYHPPMQQQVAPRGDYYEPYRPNRQG